MALALEAEQLDKRLKAVRNRFDPLNESSLFSVAERDLNAELHEGLDALAAQRTSDQRDIVERLRDTPNWRCAANPTQVKQ